MEVSNHGTYAVLDILHMVPTFYAHDDDSHDDHTRYGDRNNYYVWNV